MATASPSGILRRVRRRLPPSPRALAYRALRSAAERWLRRPRTSRFGGLTLVAPPGVFHPGVFFSTRAMVDWLGRQPLAGLRVLDLGSGSGALGIAAARGGAHVTAVELNPLAQVATLDNAARNDVRVHLVAGDGLAALPPDARFDLLMSNPPWFEGEAEDAAALAFRAGTGLRFLHALFEQAPRHLAAEGRLITVLGASADFDAIAAIAARYGAWPESLERRRVGWEWQRIDQWRYDAADGPGYQS